MLAGRCLSRSLIIVSDKKELSAQFFFYLEKSDN